MDIRADVWGKKLLPTAPSAGEQSLFCCVDVFGPKVRTHDPRGFLNQKDFMQSNFGLIFRSLTLEQKETTRNFIVVLTQEISLWSSLLQVDGWDTDSQRRCATTLAPDVQPLCFVALPDWAPHPGNHST